MKPCQQENTTLIRTTELLYLLLIALSFFLLILSRTGEAYTVWEVLHPAFLPALFIATSLLVIILLSSEKATPKLSLIIAHSILIHSLFSIVFPAGDLSGQQMVLGRIRLIYENAAPHGWPPWPQETVIARIYEWFNGINFQAALSTILTRMLGIDLFWTHLFFIPVLWGVFTPIAGYLITHTFTSNEKIAALSSLLISASPYPIYFGAISVPNSLGFILFLYSLYFMLKYLQSNDTKTTALMLTFWLLSQPAHNLTGIITLSLLLLTITFKWYKNEKAPTKTAKTLVITVFILSVSLLPLSLIYLRLLRPKTRTIFTLNKFYELPIKEIIGLTLIGELAYAFDLEATIIILIGPAIALISIIYYLHRSKKEATKEFSVYLTFLSAAFLITLIDYRILKLFMERTPFNAERLWVFRDLLAAPFVALATHNTISSINKFMKKHYPTKTQTQSLKLFSKQTASRSSILLLTINMITSIILGGWITTSVQVAYPRIPFVLQTTWYELEAVTYIEEHTNQKYVVIGDVWTIYAGERIVGVNNPRAYYFLESNKTGHDLFLNMTQNPSPQWMLSAMNHTNTTVAYFIITQPRLDINLERAKEKFDDIYSKALQNGLKIFGPTEGFGNGKLYIFNYEKPRTP